MTLQTKLKFLSVVKSIQVQYNTPKNWIQYLDMFLWKVILLLSNNEILYKPLIKAAVWVIIY